MDHDLQVKTYSPARSLGHARRRAAVMLLVATAIAAVLCVALFTSVLYGEWMTSAFARVSDFMFEQPVWAIAAATSPLAGALLVGYGYMQRAIRKRGAEREAALHEATAQPPSQPSQSQA
jgi:hypothetical protein